MFELIKIDYDGREVFVEEFKDEEGCYEFGYEYKERWVEEDENLFIYKDGEVYAMV